MKFNSLTLRGEEKIMSPKINLIVLALGGLVGILVSSTAHAAPVNVANQAPIIGGTNDINGQPYNATVTSGGVDNFITSNVTDGANATPENDTGGITETFADNSYWLGPNSASTAYFVIDLGRPYLIDHMDLFNTSNGSPEDRGTGNFSVKASNTLTSAGALGMDLSGTILTLATGTLSPEPSSPTSVVDQGPFASSDTSNYYQYIRFDALSMAAGAPNGVGLNEIRIFAVPEPSSMSLLALGALVTCSRRARRA